MTVSLLHPSDSIQSSTSALTARDLLSSPIITNV
jgi:hypothetical protein